MDKDKYNDFLDGIGQIAEVSLIYYRDLITAGASEEMADKLTHLFLSALVGRKPGNKKKGEE